MPGSVQGSKGDEDKAGQEADLGEVPGTSQLTNLLQTGWGQQKPLTAESAMVQGSLVWQTAPSLLPVF